MPICVPRGCGCSLTGSAVMGGSGEVGSPYEIEAGGLTVCTSSTRPGSPFQGQQIYETDTKLEYTYVSSSWRPRNLSAFSCVAATNGTVNVADNTNTYPSLTLETYDPLGWHSTSVNTERITPNIAGYYRATANFFWGTDNDWGRQLIDIFVNGAGVVGPYRFEQNTAGLSSIVSGAASLVAPVTLMNGSTDYFSIRAYQTNTSTGTNTLMAELSVTLLALA